MKEDELWNGYYKKGETPWQSAGLSALVKGFLARYACGKSVLEVGAGNGSDARGFIGEGYDYTGVDISAEAISLAKTKIPKGTFITADFLKWPLPRTFAVVYDKGVFHNMPGVRKRNAFARRVAAALDKGGMWVCVCGSADNYDPNNPHGAIFLQHLIEPAERYFEVLEVIKAPYGTTHEGGQFDAWYCVFRRR